MNHTARNFALQLGSLATLYISLGAILALLFNLIDITFPDAAAAYWTLASANEGVRFSIAMLVVFFPAYLMLTRRVNQIRRADESGAYLSITKWLVYLSLLVAGAVLLGDLVSVLYTFLNGEITARFILKVCAILLIVGAAFYYYAKDAQGYWTNHERQSIIFGLTAAVIVLVSVVIGFLKIENPTVVREMKLDAEQVRDFENIQWRIQDYYRAEDRLPANLTVVYVGETPSAPEERPAYEYIVTSDTTYQLCATFAHDNVTTGYELRPAYDHNYAWEHQAGAWCFDREIELEALK